MFFSPAAADLFQFHTDAALAKHDIVHVQPPSNARKRPREEEAETRVTSHGVRAPSVLVVDGCKMELMEKEAEDRVTPMPFVKITAPNGVITVKVISAIYAITASYVHVSRLMTIDQKSEAWHDARGIAFQVNGGKMWRVSRFTGTSMGDIYAHGEDMSQDIYRDVFDMLDPLVEVSKNKPVYVDVLQILEKLNSNKVYTPVRDLMKYANELVTGSAFVANSYMRYGVAMEDTACHQMMKHIGFLQVNRDVNCLLEASGICINANDPTLASSADMLISTVGQATDQPLFVDDDKTHSVPTAPQLIVRDLRVGECKAMAAASTRMYSGSMGDEEDQLVNTPGCAKAWVHVTYLTPTKDIETIIDGVVDIGLIEKWLCMELTKNHIPGQDKWISQRLNGQTAQARRDNVAFRVGLAPLTFEHPKIHYGRPVKTRVAEEKYTLQMMLNMHNTGAQVCYYLRWAVHAFLVERVNYNKEFFAGVLDQVKTFREKIYWPMLCIAVNSQAHQ